MRFFRVILLCCSFLIIDQLQAQKYQISYFGTQSVGTLSQKAGKYSISISGGDGGGKSVQTSSGKYVITPGIFSAPNPAIPVSENDSMILVRIFEETNGENWLEPWTLEDSVYTWEGITLSEEGTVTEVKIPSNNLTGILPTKWAFPDSMYIIDNFDEGEEVRINVFGNRLDFGSLEPVADFLENEFFLYDSQAVIGEPLDTTILRGMAVPLAIETLGEHNTYQWFLENQKIEGATDSIYWIRNMNYPDTGIYYCQIRNEIAQETVLQTYEMRVNIADPITVQDSLALVQFYSVTGGENWLRSWELKNPVITWGGLIFKNNELIEINLSGNNLIGVIPDFLDTALIFRNLRSLNLSANQLDGEIPKGLGKLKKLVLLDLDKNNLTGKVPVALTQLPHLRTLWISRNKFTNLPDSVHEWKTLQYLFAHGNQIREIPSSFKDMDELKILNLNDNELQELPSFLPDLNSLEIFYAARNQLTNIAQNIGKMPELKVLDLTDNQLKNLPISMSRFEKLEQLKVGQNLLQFAPLEPIIDRKYLLFDYNPQTAVGEIQEFNLDVNEAFEISVSVTGTENSYQWYKNNEKIIGASSPNYQISEVQNKSAGIYHCLVSNRKAKDLVLRSLPNTLNIACGEGLSAHISTEDAIVYCPEANMITKLEAKISRDNLEVRWFRDNIEIFGANGNTYFAKEAGAFHVRVTDGSNCSVTSNKLSINRLPQRYADIRSDSSVLYLYETNAEITDYQWYFYDEAIEGATSSKYQAEKDGVYVLKFTDKNNCTAYSNSVRVINTATENTSLTKDIKLYPNPVQDFFYVGTPLSLGEVHLHIFSVKGEEMTNINITETGRNEKRLDMRQLPSGMYIITIATDEGDIIRRIIKQ